MWAVLGVSAVPLRWDEASWGSGEFETHLLGPTHEHLKDTADAICFWFMLLVHCCVACLWLVSNLTLKSFKNHVTLKVYVFEIGEEMGLGKTSSEAL